jgi:tRNA threonylcarbamoyladenosine biosynthesis protein TsaB
MAYILHIDTATETAQVALSHNGTVVTSLAHGNPKDHAGFLQPALHSLLQQAHIGFGQLAAVAVTDGPGSYTGLRVGMASAKGLCYALRIPLITLGTLRLMAASALEQLSGPAEDTLLGPLIDARRMEVFAALFTPHLDEWMAPGPMVLTETSFAEVLANRPICFFGSGAAKFRPFCPPGGLFLDNFDISMHSFAQITTQMFDNQQFTDVAYAEPAYGKAFFSTQKRQAQ